MASESLPSSGTAPDLGARLFTFAVVADTHVNQSDDASTSPFLTNRLANGRARRVFHDIARMSPAPQFGVHLGDMVHPLPSLPLYHDAVDRYRELVSLAEVPFHAVPGNHDIGDKNVSWMPADKVCEPYVRIYREAFGKDHYAFAHRGVRFIVVNSLLLNSGLADEAEQAEWLERELAESARDRVMVFMHYPPYICDVDERGNYDNIDEPARSWLLALLRKPQVEAVFAGHTHNFWYDRIGTAEFYTLPSTAFVRHDFAEFSRVAPGDEFGRNDLGKFGYFRVDVHERGHVAYLIRTQGASEVAARATAASDHRAALLAHPKTSTMNRVGFELRHPWTERMQIAATGGVQEFGRKWARNDYPMLALLEMGARLSKVPELDLQEEASAQRMRLLAQLGHRFVVTTLGAPKSKADAARLGASGVSAFEVNATRESLQGQFADLDALRRRTGVQVHFAPLHVGSHANFDGKQFSHLVKSGYTLHELEDDSEFVVRALAAGAVDGITVRVEADEPLVAAARRMHDFAEKTGCALLASLKLEGSNLARERADDRRNVLRAAQAALLSTTSERIVYIFDTFMDVDRGYFPRTAFIDRRFDPRPPARAFATLAALLAEDGGAPFRCEFQEEERLVVASERSRYALFTGDARSIGRQLASQEPTTPLFDLIDDSASDVSTWLARHAETPDAREGLQVVLARSGGVPRPGYPRRA
jgi:3',5'-cyclic AMP phosphodiesterase CpdA